VQGQTDTKPQHGSEFATLHTKGQRRKRQAIFNSGFCDLQRDAADTSNQGLQGGKVNRSIEGIRTNRNKLFTGCIPSNWQDFPTQSPICGGDDGLPTQLDGITFSKWRKESIKAAGNAIVPQVVYQIFKAIQDYEIKFF